MTNTEKEKENTFHNYSNRKNGAEGRVDVQLVEVLEADKLFCFLAKGSLESFSARVSLLHVFKERNTTDHDRFED